MLPRGKNLNPSDPGGEDLVQDVRGEALVDEQVSRESEVHQ
jgi:hypothetical protein